MMHYMLGVLPHDMISIGYRVESGFQNREGLTAFDKNTFTFLFSEEAAISPEMKDFGTKY